MLHHRFANATQVLLCKAQTIPAAGMALAASWSGEEAGWQPDYRQLQGRQADVARATKVGEFKGIEPGSPTLKDERPIADISCALPCRPRRLLHPEAPSRLSLSKGQPTLEATCMSWMNSIGSNEQVASTLEEAWGVATMTFWLWILLWV